MISMPRQFWNEEQTSKSRALLNKLSSEVDFVLIGGWAVFMYTKQQMSLDLDIAIGYDALAYFRKYGINDYNGFSIKYSVINGVYVDLFIEGFSDKDLPVPVKEILSNYNNIEGIKVVEKELLLLLKLWGYYRSDQHKIRKDILDVIALLLYANIDFAKLKGYIEKYSIPKRRSINVLLEYIDKVTQVEDFIDVPRDELNNKLKAYKEKLRDLL